MSKPYRRIAKHILPKRTGITVVADKMLKLFGTEKSK